MGRWQDSAACEGLDPNIFVPSEGRGNNGRTAYKKAREFCGKCPVKIECLNFALQENMEFGMFGGTTPRERRSLRKVFNVVTA